MGVAEHKKQIAKEILALSGSRSPYQVFSDWVQCMAYSIENGCHPFFHNERWKNQEEEYIKIMNSYEDKGKGFVRMTNFLLEALSEEPGDILGEVFMESGCGSKTTGQFFTPFHISRLMAAYNLDQGEIDGSEPVTVYEPSCGAGGAIIATAVEMQKRGINFQRCLDVVAQDLDWKAVYMCYVQLSLLGIKAIVVQGNTLIEPYTGYGFPESRVFYTPAKVWRLY